MRILLAGAAAALLPGLAAAESYDVLSWNADRLAAVDKDSLADAGGFKRVRIVVIYAQAKGEGARAYRGMAGLQEFDCAQGRSHSLENTPFDDAGAPIADLAVKTPTSWSDIAPGTLGADARARICDGAWPGSAYRTRLPVLVAAYLLKPQPTSAPIVQVVAGPPPSAATAGVDAAAVTPH